MPGWLLPWWKTFGQQRALIRDSLRIEVVRRAGEVVGILPFMLTERPSGGPLQARSLGLLGADEYLTEQRAPIYDPAFQGDVARAVAARLRADDRWDWIRWDGLDRESEFARVLEHELPLRWGRSETANVLALAPTWDDFRAGLKRNIKESLRHGYNSLKRDGLQPRLQVAETPADVASALPTFFRMHSARAQMSGGPAHPDRFSSPKAREFLVRACHALAERRLARVFTLEIDGRPVACRVAFVVPGCLYLYYSGFDPNFGKYGVMTTTVAEIIKYAIGQGIPRLHLSMGSDVSKSRWGGATSLIYEAVSVRQKWKARSAERFYEWARENANVRGVMSPIARKRRVD
jgi:CelD/BcsL family acetyltransferase involved in cellulose biosynthesis